MTDLSLRRGSEPELQPLNDAIEQSIPKRFEEIVRTYPDRLAIKMGDRSLSYGELNRYANCIARAILEKRGPGSEPIALLLDHGIEVIAAIFGVLKAGKFFVALDPAFPISRLNLIVADSQTKLIVTNNRNWSCAQQFSRMIDTMLNVDDIDSAIGCENLDITITPATISSIMYTSGSTGEPKGVVDTHGNILESSRYLAETVRLVVDDRLSLLHTFTYASARTTAYFSLLNGASLFPFDLRTEGVERLAKWANSERLTILYCPIALFRQFANFSNEPIALSSLRILHLSGAPITRNDFELYRRRFDDSVLLEISMGSTEARGIGIALLNKNFSFPGEGNPVGYAPPGKKILILDARHKALPKGRIGQIAIQGKNLNPGYWGLPALTESRYLPDPSGGDERIYLTGDVGKLLPDGFLVHLGRQDLMVKIRGYRVNIDEVERALLEHPLVREVGVRAWDREPGEKHLAGYIVPQKDSALNVSELNAFLRNKLPDYMVPSTFIFLDSLPLTNGKLDRSALPKPNHNRPDLKTPYVAPRSDVERKLSQIWAEVLVIDPVGVDDNFFDLGGNSLTGAAIIARVKEVFGVELPVSELLASPTVAQLSEEIGRREGIEAKLRGFTQANGTGVSPMAHDPWTNKFPREELEQSIPARFAKIVNQFPDRIAIKDKDRVVTYAELDDLANRVTQTVMLRRPIQAEPVGIFLEKGVEQFASMLGVLKAGKFFVLLDPALPPSRVTALLNDSETKLVISDTGHVEVLKEASNNDLKLIVFELIDAAVPARDPGLTIPGSECAYLVYTSGSTGQPKGVIQTHRNLLHRVMLYSSDCGLEAHDRMTWLPAGTSNAITNAFTALLTGTTLCPFDVKKEGVHRLADWLVQEEISICLISSTLFRSLCQILNGSENFPHLRFLRIRSESAYKADFDLFKRHFSSGCVLVNGLSSTETGPVCEYPMNHSTTICSNGLPVGYALEDKDILLLDDSGRELGPNQIGEIVVRSRYLSPGYWRRPDLTTEKFAPDPRDPEKQLYYTGDLGLMLPDGCLIHKGRKDFRVKIRGYGVEIAEVEKVLRGHPAVHDTVVMAGNNESGEARLIAYFTSSPERAPTTSELRKFLGKSLPDYMVPAVFVRLEALPLTSNGKVDRKALPEPNDQRPELTTPYVLPRNQVERMLAGLWEDVLGVRPIGVNDDFFDLGGDSLKLAGLVSRLEKELGMEIAAREVLEAPRISSLGGLIDTKASVAYQAANGQRALQYLVNLRVGSGEKRIFCFPYRGGFRDEYFNFCRISRHFNDEYSFYGLRARGVKGDDRPRGTIKEIAADFMKAILSVQPHGPYIFLGECGGGIPAFETARQLQAAGEKVELLILFDTQAWSLRSTIWRRITEPLNYRKRLGLMPASWEYFEKRAQLHLKELRRRKGFAQTRYLLDKFIKLPTAVAHSIQQGKPPATGPATEAPTETNRPDVSRLRLSEKDYFIAAHRYRCRPYTGRIVLLVNQEWHEAEPSLGWQKFARGGLDIYPIPGDHDHCVPDSIAKVAQIVKECLVNARVA